MMGMATYRADAARADGPSRGQSRVAHQFLIEQRQQRDQAINAGAKQPDQNASDGEVAVPKNVQIDQRLVGVEVRE